MSSYKYVHYAQDPLREINFVIRETGSTRRIATPPEQDRATARSNLRGKFGEVWAFGFRDILVYRQTETHHRSINGQEHRINSHHPSRGENNSSIFFIVYIKVSLFVDFAPRHNAKISQS